MKIKQVTNAIDLKIVQADSEMIAVYLYCVNTGEIRIKHFTNQKIFERLFQGELKTWKRRGRIPYVGNLRMNDNLFMILDDLDGVM